MVKTINLEKYMVEETDFLSGRPEGENVRKKEKLEDFSLSDSANKIILKIPLKLIGINISFFLGIFTKTLKIFSTKEDIMKKIELEFDKNVDSEVKSLILQDIDYGISKVLDERDIDEILR